MQFSYTGVDSTSSKKSGKLEANSEKEVVEYLRENGITPISVKKNRGKEIAFFSKVKTSDVVLFTRQLSSMILTGLTLIESLNILKSQKNKPEMQKIIEDLIVKISEGSSFSKVLSDHKDVFSNVYIALIQAAEAGGLLDKILVRLADNLEKSEDLKKRVKSAFFYPAIIISGVLLVIAIMNIFVIPQLGELYKNLNLDLPVSTKIVLGISSIFTKFWPVAIIVIVLGYILFLRLKKSDSGIKTIDRLKLKLPIFGSIYTLSTLDEITRTLSLLIGSGTSIVEGLNITSNVANNIHYRNAIKNSVGMVEKGVTLSSAFEYQKLFPPILIQMVKVGESTGKIDDSLLKMSEYFQRDLDLKVRNLTTAIEPILIVVLGITVAFLILSVITPIYSLISEIQ
ncbi:MAG: hypothetical protein COU27_00530 [Candidatus Levybacteria bacterium CG10_big_fil_rev_8_21_14_0_10_36_7]|nr:MAG: hypothetical protein COU27_00530 [Candidatus Levybacteria bacterium CG10_big_fil_rev_8_21_14_0_10_36_7]